MAGNGAGQRVPSGFTGLGAVPEDFEGDGEVGFLDDTWSKVALDDIIVVAGAVRFHLLKKFNLQRAGFINARQHGKGFLDP